MENSGREIKAPSAALLALEPWGLMSIPALLAAAPFLATAPRGRRHAVIVVPGLGADDRSTVAIRRFLAHLGYDVHGWKRGRNVRAPGADLSAVAADILALHAATGSAVSLVGWSRGGVIAREAARQVPHAVRMVITLGSPFAAPGASNAGFIWRRATGASFPPQTSEQLRRLAEPLPVPSTSIYSRWDGVVAWQACREEEGRDRENVEVRTTHIGLGFHPAVLWVIADRLAQAVGTWKPFQPGPLVALFFPRPAA
jgi:pimeloyl-ACP methyl ester carboxylesterase